MRKQRLVLSRFPLILLAGGKSTRMGKPKGLLSTGDKSMLEEQIRSFHKAGGSHVAVGLGYHANKYFCALPWLKEGKLRNLDIHVLTVLNPKPSQGMFSTLQVTARALLNAPWLDEGCGINKPCGFRGAFVLPVDVPAVSGKTWRLLAAKFKSGAHAIVPTYRGKGGHPVLLSKSVLKHLVTLPPTERLDIQLKRLASGRFIAITIDDPKACLNLNTANQWKLFAGETQGRARR